MKFFNKGQGGMSPFSRLVYGLVGLVGLLFLINMFNLVNFQLYYDWMKWLLVIGALNWGIIAINGKKTEDLFELLNL